MSKLRWYKRDHLAALEGMAILTLEERGAYNTILDLIYCHDGKLADDERFICGWLRCNARRWKRISKRLIELGKLDLSTDLSTGERFWHNKRADRETNGQSLAKVSANIAPNNEPVSNQINGLATGEVEDRRKKEVRSGKMLPLAAFGGSQGRKVLSGEEKKQAWAGKISAELCRRENPVRAMAIIEAWERGEQWAKDEFNRVDALLKAN